MKNQIKIRVCIPDSMPDCIFFILEAVKKNPLAKNPNDGEIEKAIKYRLKRASTRIASAKVSLICPLFRYLVSLIHI